MYALLNCPEGYCDIDQKKKGRGGEELMQKHSPFLLRHARVNADGRKVALHQKLVQLCSTAHTLHEDDHLVEV